MSPSTKESAAAIVDAARSLRRATRRLRFGPPITHIYRPLDYAWSAHCQYLTRYGRGPKKVVFLGMNPGPFGMTQTGIPFGEVNAVRHWLGIDAPIQSPARQHPKRPIQGFACERSEISGRRLWALFARRYPDAREFFKDHFVVNYCPLAFVEESGRNRTPDKIRADEAEPLNRACDRHLIRVVQSLEPEWIIGIGGFAGNRARLLFEADGKIRIGTVLHPSPASPAANRGWDLAAEGTLIRIGVWS